MSVDPSEMRDLAALAHLSVPESELAQVAADLERLLDYIARLQAVDVSGLPRDGSVTGALPLRPDVARKGLAREIIVAAAPAAPLGLFEVPRVVSRQGDAAAASADDEVAP